MRFKILLYIPFYNSLLLSNWEFLGFFFGGGGRLQYFECSIVLISIQCSQSIEQRVKDKAIYVSNLHCRFFFDFFLIKVHPNDKGIAICLEQQDFNKREKEGEREIQREWENALNYVTE